MDGGTKYTFAYAKADLGFTYTNGTNYTVKNSYENIAGVIYGRSNLFKRFIYGSYFKNLGTGGSMQYQKVIEKDEQQKTAYDSSKTSLLDQYTCTTLAKYTYNYTNEPDGFGQSGYSSDQNYLKNTYRFYAEVQDPVGAKTKYTYDGLAELIETLEYGNDHKEDTTRTYDNNKLPSKVQRLVYNVVNGQAGTTPVTRTENYTYDVYANLTAYSGPEANRDANGNVTDALHTINYTYATDKYSVLSSKAWYIDAATAARLDYTIATNGNVTQEKKTHYESGVDRSLITNYQYDSYGNLTQKSVVSTENTYVTNYEYGTDADGVNHQGAYLTKEYSTKDGTEYSIKHVYNFYSGVEKAKIDERNNRTNYTFDALWRVTQITYPDATTDTYQYQDNTLTNRSVTVIDKAGFNFGNDYDIFGNLVKTTYLDNGTWQTISEITYDGNGNKTKEKDANGHVTGFTYDSQNRLIKKYFAQSDTDTNPNSITLSYTTAYDTTTPLLVTMTDEEGYISKLYYRYFVDSGKTAFLLCL